MEERRHPEKNSNKAIIITVVGFFLVCSTLGLLYPFIVKPFETHAPRSPTPRTPIPSKGTLIKLSITPKTEGESINAQAEICAGLLRKKFSHLSFPVAVRTSYNIIELHIGSADFVDIYTVKDIINIGGDLSIHLVHRDSRQLADRVVAKETFIPGYTALQHIETDQLNGKAKTSHILIRRRAVITGKDVKAAYVSPMDYSVVNIELTEDGGKKMEAFTRSLTENVDMIATVLDGEVKNYATLAAESIGRNFVITGLDSKEEGEKLVRALQSPLNSILKVIDEQPYPSDTELGY